MPAPLPAAIRLSVTRFLLLHWRPDAIAAELHISPASVYRIQENWFIYGAPNPPRLRGKGGGTPRVSKAAEDDLIKYLEEQLWVYQKELVYYLYHEWDILVYQSTISRILKRRRISSKVAERLGLGQSEELRQHWLADLLDLTAEQLVYIDETLFNQTTGWRQRAYSPIGTPARYHADRTRGRSWSILPAYKLNGALIPPSGI